jgi:hypothetical protein
MKPASESVTLIVRGTEFGFRSLSDALRHAVEEADEKDRARMVLITRPGQKLHWPEIKRMYEEHLQGR